ncbi:hypothetical protein B0T20DRAFT_135506 [Sordaria brevicollis]|uniref:Uncharacterized protein n=1 Tax=Sordaria brevicollis TaxID=83679 RepID=A0AAE0UFJ0_SORBR|nr:hypothetical protein B0T20DRAFT_135506 [Sordaria brevicollis]
MSCRGQRVWVYDPTSLLSFISCPSILLSFPLAVLLLLLPLGINKQNVCIPWNILAGVHLLSLILQVSHIPSSSSKQYMNISSKIITCVALVD